MDANLTTTISVSWLAQHGERDLDDWKLLLSRP